MGTKITAHFLGMALCVSGFTVAQAIDAPPPLSPETRAHLRELARVFRSDPAAPDLRDACATSPTLDRYLEALYERQRALAPTTDGPGYTEGSGAIRNKDGVWIIEADSTMLAGDRPFDLAGKSLRFTPNGSGYDVAFVPYDYDPVVGDPLISGATTQTYAAATLTYFSFPMGGSSYGTLYAGTDLGIRTSGDFTNILTGRQQYTTFTAGGDLLRDPQNRLSPLFYPVQGLYKFACANVFFKTGATRAVFTWRNTLDATGDLDCDVQAALYPDGSIVFTYAMVRNMDNGAPLVYTGISAWLAGFSTAGTASDPAEAFPDPIDIRSLSLRTDSSTDMNHVRVTMDGAIPSNSSTRYEYYMILQQGGQSRYAFYTWVDSAGRGPLYMYTYATTTWGVVGNPVFIGSNWEIMFDLAGMPNLAAGSTTFQMYTYQNGSSADSLSLTASVAGGPPFSRDYTAQAPFTASGPIVETFPFPTFIPHGVKDKLLAHTGWPEAALDGIPMFQTFFTDLIFYAGAYYTYGNCGAANIGRCNSSQPLRPGLLHMNKTNYGWNDNVFRPYGWATVLSHEFGHHWLQQVNIREGASNTNVLNPESSHPAAYVGTWARTPFLYSDDSSVMGGGSWSSAGGSTYVTGDHWTYFSFAAYELYLMGLLGTGSVTDWFYLANTNPPQPLSYFPAPNTTVTADFRNVTITQLTDAMGFRNPSVATSKKDFFAPLVLVVRPGEEPSPSDWDFMMSVRQPWREAFYTQTGGLGTLVTVSPREVSPPGETPLRVERNGNQLRLFFENPAFGDQLRYNVYEGPLAPGSAFDDWTLLAGNLHATDAGGGELHADVSPSSGDRYYLVSMSNLAGFEGGFGADSDGQPRLKPVVSQTATQATNLSIAKNGGAQVDFTPAFTLSPSVTSAVLTSPTMSGPSATVIQNNVTMKVVTPNGTVQALKACGATLAASYNITALYNGANGGPGTWRLCVIYGNPTTCGSGCSSPAGTPPDLSVSGASMTVTK